MFDNFFFSKTVPFMRCGKVFYSLAGHRWQYGEWTLHAGHRRLQTHTLRI